MNIYIFVLLIIITLLYINYNRENFTSNLVPIKNVSAHFCDKLLDTTTDNKERHNIGEFCKTYPNTTYFDKITTLIIPNKTSINKKMVKILNTKNLKINKSFNNNYIENTFKNGSLLRKQNLMKNEALTACSNDSICEAVSINNDVKHIGKAKFWATGKHSINTKNKTVYSKSYNYEYSITFWIKITNLNKSWRNIFQHGNNSKHRFPGVWIKPNSTSLQFAISTTHKDETSWGEQLYIDNVPLNKWCHIAITVKNNTVETYLNGVPSSQLDLVGSILWPMNEKVYISNPWNETGHFELSKFQWIGIEINKYFIENLAYNTFPDGSFNSKNAQTIIDIPGTITFNHGWNEHLGSLSLEEVRLRKEGNIIFIDGYINYTKTIIPGKNLNVGTIPKSYTPDRDCSFVLYIKGGYLICTIKKDSTVMINSTAHYKENSIISLSNIRYPMIEGEKLDKDSNISHSSIGGYVFLSGKAKLYKGCYKDCKGRDLPKHVGNHDVEGCKEQAIKNNLKYYGLQYQNGIGKGNRPLGECWIGNSYGSQGTTNKCKTIGKEVYGQSCTNAVYKVMGKLNSNIKSSYPINSFGINSSGELHKINIIDNKINIKNGTSIISMEGINWSTYNGENLKLYNNYSSVNEATKPRVMIDNNIVKLTGTLIKYYRKAGNYGSEKIVHLEKKYRPKKTLAFLCYSEQGTVRIKVKNNGDVMWEGVDNGPNSNNKFSLDNISFIYT